MQLGITKPTYIAKYRVHPNSMTICSILGNLQADSFNSVWNFTAEQIVFSPFSLNSTCTMDSFISTKLGVHLGKHWILASILLNSNAFATATLQSFVPKTNLCAHGMCGHIGAVTTSGVLHKKLCFALLVMKATEASRTSPY